MAVLLTEVERDRRSKSAVVKYGVCCHMSTRSSYYTRYRVGLLGAVKFAVLLTEVERNGQSERLLFSSKAFATA
jgi:hypothetical protein